MLLRVPCNGMSAGDVHVDRPLKKNLGSAVLRRFMRMCARVHVQQLYSLGLGSLVFCLVSAVC